MNSKEINIAASVWRSW